MNIEAIPRDVLRDLKKRLTDDQIEASTPEQLFAEYCTWHGLIGWGSQLVSVLDALRQAK